MTTESLPIPGDTIGAMARKGMREALDADLDYRSARRPMTRDDLDAEGHTQSWLAHDRREALATSDHSGVTERASKLRTAHGYVVDAGSESFYLLRAERLHADVASDEIVAARLRAAVAEEHRLRQL